ncbi:unnamed protein product [Parajaminaea phylloscopi]
MSSVKAAASKGAAGNVAPWEAYKMYTSSEAYVFEPTLGGAGAKKEYLVVHRTQEGGDNADDPPPKLTLAPTLPADAQRKGKTVDVLGILGLIPLHTTYFLVVITARSHVTTLLGSPIYMATDFRLFPISPKADKSLMKHPVEKTLLELLKSHLYSAPFYFSHGWDLTSSLQRQAQVLQQAASQGKRALAPWEKADERFFWNRYLSDPLIKATTAPQGPDLGRFILPCVFGFFSLKNATINGHDFLFGLIARRSRHRAGTRYFSRGIDAEGNVSNFNETEQFIILDPPGSRSGAIEGRLRFSYVQTRGSVPVYWAEVNNLRYKPDLVVMEREETGAATAQHFKNQVEIYGDNYLVNLVNQSGYEKAVKDAYERAVNRLENSRVHYTYYDFHHECKGMKFEKVWNLVERLEKLGLRGQDWFELDVDGDSASVVSRQTSVVRTNCMDCLDRTNVVQSTLGRWVLTYQLRKAGVLAEDEWVDGPKNNNFMYLFRNVWADHADGVSKAYSGTGALKTDFTRTGKRSKEGALQDGVNSVTRYVKNNFFDGPRQDAYDLFTGAWTPAKGVSGTKRSLVIRSVPYVLAFSFFMILSGLILPHRTPGSGTSDAYAMPAWTYLTLWFTILAFALRFIADQGVEFVAYPSLNRQVYDDLIRYNGAGWSSGRYGRGPGGPTSRWGGNRKGGKYSGMGAGFDPDAKSPSNARAEKSPSARARRGEGYDQE